MLSWTVPVATIRHCAPDWPTFIHRLKTVQNPDVAPAEVISLWAHFPAVIRQRILALSGEATFDQRTGVAKSLGFFQDRFPGQSPAWRYVADSSYWIYLAHLPLVAALQVWMAPWPWPGAMKFLLLNAVAFAFLFASYHYLARSTFIGRLPNGQGHPFVAWPLRRNAGMAAAAGGAPRLSGMGSP
jgi:hypothetical protein